VGEEVCDSGTKEGCIDCKKVKDGWTCSKGSDRSPSICSQGSATSQAMVSSATSTA